MKKQIRLLPLLAILWAASTAHAQVVYQFSADDGAPDPAIWTPFNHGVNPPTLTNYQNEAVFVIADDLTDNSAARYTRTLTTTEANTLNTRGCRIHARVALLEENLNQNVTCNLSYDNEFKRYSLWLRKNSDGELELQLGDSPNQMRISTGLENPHDLFNIALDFAPNATSCQVLVNGEVIYAAWTGDTSTGPALLRFGALTESGRGAAAWNRVQIASRVPASDMTFVYDSDTDSYELDLVNDVFGHLHVPDTFNDGTNGVKNVTEIGAFACSPNYVGHTDLVGLRLPSSLTEIGSYAFRDCSGFSGSLTIPDSLTSIDHNAFQNCSGFTGELTLPEPHLPTTGGFTSIDRGWAIQTSPTSVIMPSVSAVAARSPFQRASPPSRTPLFENAAALMVRSRFQRVLPPSKIMPSIDAAASFAPALTHHPARSPPSASTPPSAICPRS